MKEIKEKVTIIWLLLIIFCVSCEKSEIHYITSSTSNEAGLYDESQGFKTSTAAIWAKDYLQGLQVSLTTNEVNNYTCHVRFKFEPYQYINGVWYYHLTNPELLINNRVQGWYDFPPITKEYTFQFIPGRPTVVYYYLCEINISYMNYSYEKYNQTYYQYTMEILNTKLIVKDV